MKVPHSGGGGPPQTLISKERSEHLDSGRKESAESAASAQAVGYGQGMSTQLLTRACRQEQHCWLGSEAWLQSPSLQGPSEAVPESGSAWPGSDC